MPYLYMTGKEEGNIHYLYRFSVIGGPQDVVTGRTILKDGQSIQSGCGGQNGGLRQVLALVL